MLAPAESTFLTRLLEVSAMYRLLSAPIAIAVLREPPSSALSADRPAPLRQVTGPPPTQMLIFPSVVTRRTATPSSTPLIRPWSTKYTFPGPSTRSEEHTSEL